MVQSEEINEGKKHIPLRMCAGCRQRRPRKELLRITKTKDGFRFDRKMEMPGRGVWVCPNKDCLDLAIKKKAIDRGLHSNLSESDAEELINLLHS